MKVLSGSAWPSCSQLRSAGTCPPSSLRRGTLHSTTRHSSIEVSLPWLTAVSPSCWVVRHILLICCTISDDSCRSHLHVCLAGAIWFMGFPDLAARGWEADWRLLLPGDGVCLRLLPLHLHSHLGESFSLSWGALVHVRVTESHPDDQLSQASILM